MRVAVTDTRGAWVSACAWTVVAVVALTACNFEVQGVVARCHGRPCMGGTSDAGRPRSWQPGGDVGGLLRAGIGTEGEVANAPISSP
jgi:hypothetical protein